MPPQTMATPSYLSAASSSTVDDGSNNDNDTTKKFKFVRPDDDKIVPPEVVASKSIGPQNVDALLVKEMNQLSFEDRDQVYQEIHGVMEVIDERPSMVNQCLEELEMELWRLSDEDLSAYRLAHSINPSYTTDPKLRLQFLRAERFRTNTAARRLARYFREKLILFGPEKVGKERITLDDLSDDDKASLSSGYMQWLPARDRSGRTIYWTTPGLQHWRDRSNVLRALWYFLSSVLEDEETQKRGIIVVHYLMARYDNMFANDIVDRRVVYHIGVLITTIPVRVESMQVCCNQLATVLASKILLYLTGEEMRVRTRWHLGSSVEVLYAIAPFGIPVEMFPLKADGEFDMEPHHYWMEMRRQIDRQYTKEEVGGGQNSHAPLAPVSVHVSSTMDAEDGPNSSQQESGDGVSSSSSHSGVAIPRPHDVLLGNLKATQMQLGNALFRRLVEDYRDEYDRSTTKLEKMKISKKIISQIKAGGARFLKQTNYKYGKDGRIIKRENGAQTTIGWIEVPDHVARERISHAFRNLRARIQSKGSVTPEAPRSSVDLTASLTNGDVPMVGTTAAAASLLGVYRGGSDSEGDGGCCMWTSSSKARASSVTYGCFGGGSSRQSSFA